MIRKCLTVGMVAAVVLLSSAGIASAEPVQVNAMEKTVAKVQPSVVFLDVEWSAWVYDTYNESYLNNGDPFTLNSFCTGFVIDPEGYIATAGHCVDPTAVTPDILDIAAQWTLDSNYYVGGRNFAQVRGWAETDYRIEGEGDNAGGSYTNGADFEVQAAWSTSSTEPITDEDGELNGTQYGARVVGLEPWNDGAGDTAILKVDVPDPLVALPLASSDSVTTGTEIVSVGYPASVGSVTDMSLSDPSFKEGSISSVRTSGSYPIYETSAALSGGMSGGPTVNLRGEVVGINSFGISGEVESFEFIQAVSTLEEVLTEAGVDAQVGEPGTWYRAGLTAYYAGEKDEAVENLTKATKTAPDFELADEYLTKAQALPDPSSPIIPILIGGVALVVLAGGLLFLVHRRRKKSKGASGGGHPLRLVPEAEVVVPLPRTAAYAAQALPSPPAQLADAEVVRGVLHAHDAEPDRPLMPV